jgi:branched-chain amino acid transport system permease protein
MGIRADRVVTAAFAVSGFLAGIAAIFIISKRGAVDPFMGFIPVIKAFVATVLGGFGSLTGAVIGGLFLGVIEVTLDVYLGPSVEGFRDAFVFLVVGGLLVIRPQGLLGVRSRVTT